MFNQILPFAQMLMQAGVDPMKFLQTPQGQALLGPIRESIGQEFDQSRTNMYDFFSGSGVDPRGSGLAAGPMANMFSSEASAQSNALRDFIANTLQMGQAGAGLLSGQQQIFNPGTAGGLSNQAGHQVINAPAGPGWGLAQAGIGALGQGLSAYMTGGASLAGGGPFGQGAPLGTMLPPCLVAAELYGETPKTWQLRLWLISFVEPTGWGFFVRFYRRNGELLAKMVREFSVVRYIARKLFDRMWLRCQEQLKGLTIGSVLPK
jgi:hypothetical protein